MNLIKWLRKNNTKVMAVVVIFIFVGFVGEAYFTQLRQRRTDQRGKAIAHFADNKAITNYDMTLARQELEILKLLQADKILRNISLPMLRTIDLHAVLLAELLFPDRTISPSLTSYIKQMVGTYHYRISEKQINDIYRRRSMSAEIYWLLLKNEAHLAGVKTSNEISGIQLAKIIPQLFEGKTYPQVVEAITSQQGISEDEILTAFSDLTTILMYSRMICAGEDVTLSQMMHDASWEDETIDVNFVKVNSAVFAKNQSEPSEKELTEQFDKYKDFFAGDVNDQNPYGFGYKLDDRIQLEYIAVKLDEVAAIVTAPTEEEAEEFYQKHREEFTASAPADPNEPNSPPTKRTKGYGEVAEAISKNLLQNKISAEAEKILQEARTLTEAGLQATDMEIAKISSEQFKQMAGDYAAAAKQLSEKYKIKVYTGRTGLLNVTDVLSDKYLGVLFLKGYGYNPMALTKAVFAVNELSDSELSSFDMPKPKLYENIGPARDMLGRMMAVVRVTEAEKASEPESINQTFDKSSLKFGEDQNQPDESVYSVKKIVTDDLKKLSAMDTAKSKAEEFVRLATKDGWENAVDKFNKLYGQSDEKSEADVNTFELKNFTNLQRASSMTLETVVIQNAGNPAKRLLVNKEKKESRLIDQLYSLVPQDSNTVDTLPLVMEFKPELSYYCLENFSIKRLEQEQYERTKTLQDYKEDLIQSQSLAPVHFNPENILKRMSFKLVKEGKEQADINAPSEQPEGDL